MTRLKLTQSRSAYLMGISLGFAMGGVAWLSIASYHVDVWTGQISPGVMNTAIFSGLLIAGLIFWWSRHVDHDAAADSQGVQDKYVQALDQVEGSSTKPKPEQETRRRPARAGWIAIGIVAVLLTIAGAFAGGVAVGIDDGVSRLAYTYENQGDCVELATIFVMGAAFAEIDNDNETNADSLVTAAMFLAQAAEMGATCTEWQDYSTPWEWYAATFPREDTA